MTHRDTERERDTHIHTHTHTHIRTHTHAHTVAVNKRRSWSANFWVWMVVHVLANTYFMHGDDVRLN